MSKTIEIPKKTSDPVINIILDTSQKKKQALIFCNSKRGAESQAEKIALKLPEKNDFIKISEEILKVLPSPTKQCKRLATCLRHGSAFHHAGLHYKQREIVEENFRNGKIISISATPTLAQGLDMPAFRTIIRDLKRYGYRGMQPIPVLEYEQMSGRAGRPGKEEYGEAICIAKTEAEAENIIEKYINGEPENIHSKLAVEPVLRTYVLSLISTEFVNSRMQLYEFFEQTFYAHQFQDLKEVHRIIDKMLNLLYEWGFIQYQKEDFASADEYLDDEKLISTEIGRRISQLYLDPLSAHYILTTFEKNKKFFPTGLIFMTTRCLEMLPLLNVKTSEYDDILEKLGETEKYLLEKEPSMYDQEYEDYLNAFKTTLFLSDWTDEKSEEELLQKYNIRPGEIHAKLDIGDWLLYCSLELAKLTNRKIIQNEIMKLRLRLKYGVKEELLKLLKLKNVGRVRARTLHKNGIKDLGDVKNIDIVKLSMLIGKKTAIDVKKQVGQEYEPDKVIVKPNKRKGQKNLGDF